MTKDEALKLALEALMYASYEDIEYDATCATKVLTARNAIKAALVTKDVSLPEQEPVAWISKHGVVYPLDDKDEVHPINELQPLYTAPPQRQPLTDGEIEDLYFDDFSMGELTAFARAIEAAHGIGDKT